MIPGGLEGEAETALGERLAAIPGGRDRDGRPLLLISPPPDPADRQRLARAIAYLLSVFNGDTRNSGLTVLVDAQGRSWRQTRSCVRHLSDLLRDDNVTAIVVRPEAFWDKRVDHCTRLHKNGEPLYIPLSRLHKYVESSQLPEELGGTLVYDHNKWIQGRQRVERFLKMNGEVQVEIERVTRVLVGAREGANNAARTMTQTSATYNNTCQLANLLLSDGRNLLDVYGVDSIADNIGQEILDTRSKVEKQLTLAQSRLSALHQAWNALHKSINDAKEVSKLETGVKAVTNWILNTGENLLATHNKVGYDVSSAEQLLREHETVELHCRETYGQYAETLHQIEEAAAAGVIIPEDLTAQRDFMDFVCRSLATRLERRRNVLITSARFFRLVSEYFQATSEVYEKLVMNPDLEKLDAAQVTLKQLQESQANIDELEQSVVREGEKLSDMLAMPVKDALGREVTVDYEADIVNIRDILEMTKARSDLFTDSMELQRITLQQASHVYEYENDAQQAIIWLNDLYKVMLKNHCHVGCSVPEIQHQKEEHQVFQDTAKGTFEYGCQLVNAAMSLRQGSKLGEGDNATISLRLSQAWERFTALAHAQMTRLRVTAVLHRTLNQQCKELKELASAAGVVKGSQLRKLLRSREKLLIEVARMLRLARLLKTRLKEPLTKETDECKENRNAIDAISERVAEVTLLAEKLDRVLCSLHSGEISFSRESSPESITPPPQPVSTSTQEWYGSMRRGSPGKDEGSRSEEEFQTASECTCTPPSRSSSFYTASEGDSNSSWWPIAESSPQIVVEGVVKHEVKDTQTIKLSPGGCTITRERTSRETEEAASPGSSWGSGRRTATPEPWAEGASASWRRWSSEPADEPPPPWPRQANDVEWQGESPEWPGRPPPTDVEWQPESWTPESDPPPVPPPPQAISQASTNYYGITKHALTGMF